MPGHRLDSVTVQRVAGLLAIIDVTAGGTGYATPPDVDIPGGSGATAVAVLNASGEVQRVDITDRGDGSLVAAPAINFSGGGGAGAAATSTISAAALGTPNLDQRYTLETGHITLAIT